MRIRARKRILIKMSFFVRKFVPTRLKPKLERLCNDTICFWSSSSSKSWHFETYVNNIYVGSAVDAALGGHRLIKKKQISEASISETMYSYTILTGMKVTKNLMLYRISSHAINIALGEWPKLYRRLNMIEQNGINSLRWPFYC